MVVRRFMEGQHRGGPGGRQSQRHQPVAVERDAIARRLHRRDGDGGCCWCGGGGKLLSFTAEGHAVSIDRKAAWPS